MTGCRWLNYARYIILLPLNSRPSTPIRPDAAIPPPFYDALLFKSGAGGDCEQFLRHVFQPTHKHAPITIQFHGGTRPRALFSYTTVILYLLEHPPYNYHRMNEKVKTILLYFHEGSCACKIRSEVVWR